MDNNNWIILKTFMYQHEAHMVKSLLESEGIQVVLNDELMNSVYSVAVGGVKLLVNEKDYDKSMELLKELEENQNDENDDI